MEAHKSTWSPYAASRPPSFGEKDLPLAHYVVIPSVFAFIVYEEPLLAMTLPVVFGAHTDALPLV